MKKNILIAVTMFICMCLLYWGIEFLKGINMFKPANFYYAKFEQVDGLVDAAPVTVNGFQVGQVRDIHYDYNTNQISVMLAMNRGLKIPLGSEVHLITSLTGASTIELQMGQGTEYYKVGDEIKGVFPQGLLDKVSENVMPDIIALLPKVDSILNGVNAVVSDPSLRMSVARFDAITQQLKEGTRELTTLMASLNRTVPTMMNNVDGITTNLASASSNVNDMTANWKEIPVDSTLNATMTRVNATLDNIEALSRQLNDPNSSLGLLLNDRKLYDNANSTLQDLDSLFIDIKKHPKRYINIKLL